ncbi:hypothetical protein ACSSS7_007289 [Eimeria intestinalis]
MGGTRMRGFCASTVANRIPSSSCNAKRERGPLLGVVTGAVVGIRVVKGVGGGCEERGVVGGGGARQGDVGRARRAGVFGAERAAQISRFRGGFSRVRPACVRLGSAPRLATMNFTGPQEDGPKPAANKRAQHGPEPPRAEDAERLLPRRERGRRAGFHRRAPRPRPRVPQVHGTAAQGTPSGGRQGAAPGLCVSARTRTHKPLGLKVRQKRGPRSGASQRWGEHAKRTSFQSGAGGAGRRAPDRAALKRTWRNARTCLKSAPRSRA